MYNDDGEIFAHSEEAELESHSPEELIETLNMMLDDANKGKENILIVSSSKSSRVNLKKLIGSYLKKMCNRLGIKKFFFEYSDSSRIESLIKSKSDKLNVIIHPIFFFEGFLYKMIVRKFKKYKNIMTLRPISQYEKVIDLIVDKLKT